MRAHLASRMTIIIVLICSVIRIIGCESNARFVDPCDCCNCVSLYEPRPAIDNLAFLLAGQPLPLPDRECFGGYFYAGYHYDRSFDGHKNRIAQCLFGANGTVHFTGSDAFTTGTGATVVIADYLGMGIATDLDWSPLPRIESHNLDFALRFAFDNWIQGLWLDIHIPVQFARWQLDVNTDATTASCDNNCHNGCCVSITGELDQTPFNPGYMNQVTDGGAITGDVVPTVAVASSLAEALSGNFAFGDMPGFTYSKIRFTNNCFAQGVADVSFNLGYDFISCTDYHLALYARVVAPTGTKLDACWAENFFTPIIGNGRHAELGFGVQAHSMIWHQDCDNNVAARFEGYVTHLFTNACQYRTFDFAYKGCLSRYMLLKRFTPDIAPVYDGALMSGVDYTTRQVAVTIPAKGEATLKIEWRSCGWCLGIGVEVWGRTAESICNTSVCDTPAAGFYDATKLYGFKGGTAVSAQGYALSNNTSGDASPIIAATVPADARGAFVATASNATILSLGTADYEFQLYLESPGGGGGTDYGLMYPDPRNNNPNTIVLNTTTAGERGAGSGSLLISAPPPAPTRADDGSATITDITPAIVALPPIGTDALDILSGTSPSQLTGKLFADVTYRWNGTHTPSLTIFAMGEWAPYTFSCALSQWSVGIRGGCTF